jgi:hypothetical protein
MTFITTTKTKLIRVEEDIHSQLVKLGTYGDLMSNIIEKLLQSYYSSNNNNIRYNKSMIEEKFISKVAREVGENLRPVRKRHR